MQCNKINEGNKNLIVFFNGWGSIEPPALDFADFDVILFQNYTSFEPVCIDFSKYEKKYLIAWSLGVYACSFYYDIFKDFDGFTALNGTLKPVDDNFGIPAAAYNLTIDNFNELTCRKFMKKIGAGSDITRPIDELKKELISIRDLEIKNFLPFKKAFISANDKIFPYKNMLNFWETQEAQIIECAAPHYIFGSFKSWSSFL